MLSDIQLYTDTFNGYWMQKAYLVPKNVSNGNEKPDSLAKDIVPITRLDVRSILFHQEPETIVKSGQDCEIEGLAFDYGAGIKQSGDITRQWQMGECEIGRRDRKIFVAQMALHVEASCSGLFYTIKVKATNMKGETQPEHQWNRSGYMRNEIEVLKLKAE
jgi:hypothetical protein